MTRLCTKIFGVTVWRAYKIEYNEMYSSFHMWMFFLKRDKNPWVRKMITQRSSKTGITSTSQWIPENPSCCSRDRRFSSSSRARRSKYAFWSSNSFFLFLRLHVSSRREAISRCRNRRYLLVKLTVLCRILVKWCTIFALSHVPIFHYHEKWLATERVCWWILLGSYLQMSVFNFDGHILSSWLSKIIGKPGTIALICNTSCGGQREHRLNCLLLNLPVSCMGIIDPSM